MQKNNFRRIRRRPTTHDVVNTNKESKQEQSFFGEASLETFFQPSPAIQRKCDKCEEDDKKVQRQTDKKEDENKLMKKEDLSAVAPAKEEEKKEEKLMKKEDKKEDEMLQKKEDKKEEEKIQKKDASGNSTSPITSSYIGALNSKGATMSKQAQQFFGERMGYDFSNIKVHTDKEAAQSAKEVNAKAYTVGNHIVFNEGQYNTESSEGKRLMAHELTHVIQNSNATVNGIKRTEEDVATPQEEEVLPNLSFSGEGISTDNPTHYANCNGVRVHGSTTANYTSNFTSDGNQVRARNCSGCDASHCITSTGTVTSNFSANPFVSLPSPPASLSACETTAVQNFIDTTLSSHEQQHVAAFNTYIGTITTSYTFTGCVSGLQAHIEAIHHRVDTARRRASNALSAALDANGANIFTVTCNCPDPSPNADAGK
jgi:hypothetical protein